MQIGSDTQTAFMVGDTVVAVTDNCAGTVVSVGTDIFIVRWSNGSFSVEYPTDTEQVRKAWPWET